MLLYATLPRLANTFVLPRLGLGLWLRTVVVLLLLPTLLTAASPQVISFHLVKPEVLEQRLGQVATRNKERQLRLAALLKEAGCTGERLQLQKVGRSRLPNVICTLQGQSPDVIVVGAHFDMTSRGQGLVDNWSGAALLPSLVEGLLQSPRRHTFVFVGFTDEEVGRIGSQGYVAALSAEERASVRAMVNLDTLGLSSTKGWLSRADRELANTLAATASAIQSPFHWVNVDSVGTTDSESFRDRGIPAITIHSLTQETISILHSPRDNRAALRFEDYFETYRLVAAYLVVLDARLASSEDPPPPQDGAEQ